MIYVFKLKKIYFDNSNQIIKMVCFKTIDYLFSLMKYYDDEDNEDNEDIIDFLNSQQYLIFQYLFWSSNYSETINQL